MCFSYPYKFLAYEQAVKHTHCHDNLSVINAYVHMGLEQAQMCHGKSCTKKAHMRIYFTLEETLCDSIHPLKWRLHCQRMLRRLLPLMHELCSEQEYCKYVARLRRFEEYFLNEIKECEKTKTADGAVSQNRHQK